MHRQIITPSGQGQSQCRRVHKLASPVGQSRKTAFGINIRLMQRKSEFDKQVAVATRLASPKKQGCPRKE